METITGECPLGSTCETVGKREGRDVVIRCPWYQKVQGADPQDANATIDEWRCAIAWLPLLTINAADQSRKGAASVDKLNNLFHKAINPNNTKSIENTTN